MGVRQDHPGIQIVAAFLCEMGPGLAEADRQTLAVRIVQGLADRGLLATTLTLQIDTSPAEDALDLVRAKVAALKDEIRSFARLVE